MARPYSEMRHDQPPPRLLPGGSVPVVMPIPVTAELEALAAAIYWQGWPSIPTNQFQQQLQRADFKLLVQVDGYEQYLQSRRGRIHDDYLYIVVRHASGLIAGWEDL